MALLGAAGAAAAPAKFQLDPGAAAIGTSVSETDLSVAFYNIKGSGT